MSDALDEYETVREAYEALDAFTASRPIGRERLLSIRYDGTALGDHRAAMYTSEAGESQGKQFREAMSFAHLAVGANIDHTITNIVNVDPPDPDLLVTLTDGSDVFVEVSQVVEKSSARESATMVAINKIVSDRYYDDAEYARISAGRHLDFRFPTVPKSREIQRVADEMIAILYATDFATVKRKVFLVPASTVAPTLVRLGARYSVGEGESTSLLAQLDANAFDPIDAVEDVYERLADKMQKIYSHGKQIWLALVLNDSKHVSSLSMQAIRKRVPQTVGQFARVIVGTMEDAMIFEPTSPTVKAETFTSEAPVSGTSVESTSDLRSEESEIVSLYHATLDSASKLILSNGFVDSTNFEKTGVWLSTPAVRNLNHNGVAHDTLICVNMPKAVADQYPDDPEIPAYLKTMAGQQFRQFCIPASIVNKYMPFKIVLQDDN